MISANFGWWRIGCAVVLLSATAIIASQAFTTLVSFNVTDGSLPYYGSLVQGTDGNLYGTTATGGAFGDVNSGGSVFKVTSSGALTTVYSFCAQASCADGETPEGGLALGTDGNFYGTTLNGGANGSGTVFKLTPGGTLTTLYSFCSRTNCADGAQPIGGLVQATNGAFYGTTHSGGASNDGTVFKTTTGGTLTTLHSFVGSDGANPYAGLIQGTDGNLYGTAFGGGANVNFGTVFKITAGGTLTTLYSFCSQASCADGYEPIGALVQAGNGNFYGTTVFGGTNGNGTVFQITSAGKLSTLHSFAGAPTEGFSPSGALVQGTNGIFYGTTQGGGANGTYGTLFSITSGGTLTTLYSFCSQTNCTDGANPYGGLVQATNGTFYGTTNIDGTNGPYGTVLSLGEGLGDFVETLPTSGKVGAAVIILGTSLTGATSVSFNGTAATFTVVSSTEITTTVPANATTGKVKVTTPRGALSSNARFRVTPVITSLTPTSGPPGTLVTITGNSLTGATSVTFGGVKATTFTVNSYTQITATVPTGAKTGKINVTTPGGTATSSATFTVT